MAVGRDGSPYALSVPVTSATGKRTGVVAALLPRCSPAAGEFAVTPIAGERPKSEPCRSTPVISGGNRPA